ncbi:MAG: hypothetical protein ACI9C1_001197 [Candidatus Aldehydirespiratoraceae bacterium]|jgi:uncharacterized protein (DUF305 family)
MNTRRQFFQASAAAAAGIAVGVASPFGDPAAAAAEQPNEADIGFCTDMTAHHVQALAMCQRVLGRDTGDPVQVAAAEVLQNQAIEVGQMRAWLTDWGQSTAPPITAMAWMDMSSMGSDDGAGMPLAIMPGLASTEEMTELSTLTGLDRGRRWLELMRAHHVGGVAMAIAAVERASIDKVVRLAQAQADVQTYEISQYDWLLARNYA